MLDCWQVGGTRSSRMQIKGNHSYKTNDRNGAAYETVFTHLIMVLKQAQYLHLQRTTEWLNTPVAPGLPEQIEVLLQVKLSLLRGRKSWNARVVITSACSRRGIGPRLQVPPVCLADVPCRCRSPVGTFPPRPRPEITKSTSRGPPGDGITGWP